MKKAPSESASQEAESLSFVRVGECLYRNPSSGTYYGLLKKHGKQIKRSLRTKNLPEARRKLRDFKSEQGRVLPGAGSVTVATLCDRYLEGVAMQAPSTVKVKRFVCDRMKKRWKGVAAIKVKKSEILTFLAQMKVGASCFNHRMQTIRAIFQLGVDDRVLVENPAGTIAHMKVPTPIRKTPPEEEFYAIVENIRSQPGSWANQSGDYIEFMGLAGLGRAETSALVWGDVNFKKRQITTFRHKTVAGFVIPIFPQVLPLLERRYRDARDANGGRPPPPTAKVFALADPKTALDNATERLGLPHYTSRSFRRLFITHAIEIGVDVKVIAEWQAHADGGKLILNTYSHVRPIHSERMAKLMRMGFSIPKDDADKESVESSG